MSLVHVPTRSDLFVAFPQFDSPIGITLDIDPMATGSDDSSKSYLPWTVTVSNEYQTTANNGTALKASQSKEGTNDDTVTDEKDISTETDPDAAATAIVVSVAATSSMKQTWGNKSISVSADLIGAAEATYTGTITATISAT